MAPFSTELGVVSTTSVLLSSAIIATAWYLYTGYMNDDQMPTDFDSYLANSEYKGTANKVPETDFENWIRKPDPTTTTHKFSSTETSDSEEQPAGAPAPHLKPVGVLYGTEFGLSREVCEKLCDKLSTTNKYHPILLSMDDYPSGLDLTKFQALMVACSTQGEGVPPTDARAFCQWLQSDEAPMVPKLKFSVCALGDTSYTHFAQCGKDLDARLEQLAGGSNRLVARVDVNKEDWSAFDGWIDSVLTGLDALELNTIGELDDSFVAGTVAGAAVAGVADATACFSKSKPYVADIISVSSLCSTTGVEDKNTIRVDIDLGDSGLSYQPGDSLGVWPQNNPTAVDDILELMGWNATEMLPRPNWHYKASTEASHMDKNGKMSLRDLLTTCYDLKAPKPDLVDFLSSNCGKQPQGEDRAAYLEKRHVIDVLRDFFSPNASGEASEAMPAATMVKYLRQLVPRLYSISSTPLEDPTKVTLTVAVVEYEQLGIGRQGVCSTQLHNRVSPGSKIPVYVYDNPDFRLPEAHDTPIIMVGPGTGVAPFRSFIRHRAHAAPQGAPMAASENILFFGSRRREQDFLYGDEFDALEKDGKLHLVTAFSREQKEKVYVQDRIKEQADLVWNALENKGHFYICGDGEHMCGAVELALEQLVSERIGQRQGNNADQIQGGDAREAAKAYIADLVASSRFQTDVWY